MLVVHTLDIKNLQKLHLQRESMIVKIWTILDSFPCVTKGVTENKSVPLN